ncbi:MAG: preprotein translocase subunit SecA [Planctomycetota bacterium]|jgi:preprotein translocase subunit SecA|nr:preprotein translocase subunit SecA [Planctomycetota bacterium]
MSISDSILENLSRVFSVVFGSANDRELRRLWPRVLEVRDAWEKIRGLPDSEIKAKTSEFRRRLLAGETEDAILPEAFAAVREASHRTLGGGMLVDAAYDEIVMEGGKFAYKPVEGKIRLFAHFDVQVLGGIVLKEGKIAEMVTGEGKTLVATLPSYLKALRPADSWIKLAGREQGDDSTGWIFQPYGLFRDENGVEEWRLLERLWPEAGEERMFRRPEIIVPVSRGVHVVTVNDYLAKRDSEYNRPLFEFLDMRVGAIQSGMDSEERYPVYRGDVVYGTNSEFGFDYLRDNLKVRAEDQVQADRHYAIVDEVDSVLIDEARTPLIISGSTHQTADKYYDADRVARKLKGGEQNRLEDSIAEIMRGEGLQREDARVRAEEAWDYVYSERDHSAKLTERGMHQVLRLLGMRDIYSGENLDMPHYIDNALRAHALYKKDHHYIVRDGEVFIVDEFTGRVMEGRRWSDGLHQAVEAKEQLAIKEESQTVATITYQNFFRLYDSLAGMTGTAMTEAKEFDRIYRLGVVAIPTNRPLRRINYPDLVYGTLGEKYNAIIEHVADVHASGQPILIGTVSIERSEIISQMLDRRGIVHEVLNAKNHAREALIIAEAGKMGAVTVATNMAGRGTDIKLGSFTRSELLEHWRRRDIAPKKGAEADSPPEALNRVLLEHWVDHYLRFPESKSREVKFADRRPDEWEAELGAFWRECGVHGPALVETVAGLGGLHIVGTERHEARRIDNQLRGRSGRQGDPGSSRFFLSLEDDTMRMFAADKVKRFMQWAGLRDGIPIESRMVSRTVENAQRKVEERNFEIRKNLLEYDQVMNEQRLVVYGLRQRWVEGEGLRESILEYSANFIARQARDLLAAPAEEWDFVGLAEQLRNFFPIAPDPERMRALAGGGEEKLSSHLTECLEEAYAAREARLGPEVTRMIEKLILLETIDRKWMDHLYAMDLLKDAIHLRSLGQQDPKTRYKIEGFEMFQEMWGHFENEVAQLAMRVNPAPVDRDMRPKERIRAAETARRDFASRADSANQVGAEAGGPGRATIRNAGRKIGPNDPCPCGSGKKYKKCCGRKR